MRASVVTVSLLEKLQKFPVLLEPDCVIEIQA